MSAQMEQNSTQIAQLSTKIDLSIRTMNEGFQVWLKFVKKKRKYTTYLHIFAFDEIFIQIRIMNDLKCGASLALDRFFFSCICCVCFYPALQIALFDVTFSFFA